MGCQGMKRCTDDGISGALTSETVYSSMDEPMAAHVLNIDRRGRCDIIKNRLRIMHDARKAGDMEDEIQQFFSDRRAVSGT